MKKNKKINREPIITLALYAIFFALWYFGAYSFGNDPKKYKFILGMPEWFFHSCILGYFGICLLLYLSIKFFFKDSSLDDEEEK